jgi:hypothetical protein
VVLGGIAWMWSNFHLVPLPPLTSIPRMRLEFVLWKLSLLHSFVLLDFLSVRIWYLGGTNLYFCFWISFFSKCSTSCCK